MEAGDADEALSGPRRSGAEPDRITRFASPNRFDSLDAPVSFLDRRASPSSGFGGGGFGGSGGSGASHRGSKRANVDTITRGAVPERCISSDLLIGSRTGQAYRTSHSATLVPSRTSTTQSLPVRNRSASKKKQQGMLDATGTMPRQNSQTRPESTIRLSKLTASVQRLLADREAERRAISRQQFELQIGRSGSEGCVREPAVRSCRAAKSHTVAPLGRRTLGDGSSSGWSSTDKFEPVRISQELVNDFFSSPLADDPGYGDFALAVETSREQTPAIGMKIPSSHPDPSATPTSIPSPHSVALEDSHPEISKLDAKVRTRNVIHTGVATTAKRLSLTNRARHTLSLELPPEQAPVCEEEEEEEEKKKVAPELSNGGSGGGSVEVEEEDPEFVRQLDDLAGRMGLVQRRPSRRSCNAVPKLADESYRESTAGRHMSAPEPAPVAKGKKSHRRTLSSGSGLLASFWRHFSPRLSRRGRRSLAADSGGSRQASKSDSATPGKDKGDPDWDSLSSSSQKQRPASESSCPSPNNVFSNASSTEFVQPTVNRQVMASIERDRIRDPYQSFKSRAQQQQQQQQQSSSESTRSRFALPMRVPVISRPSQLSINSASTPSSTASGPRHSSASKAPDSPGANSLSSPGPRYINVSLAAYGYGVPYRAPSKEQVDGEAPAKQNGAVEINGHGEDNHVAPRTAENGAAEAKEEAGTRTPRPATLSTDGSTSPPVARRRSKTECGWSYGDRTPGPIRRQPLWSRRRRNLSETTNRGVTPSSPLNRSFDAQTAARSSLIMLAVGHASPRPKSVSVSVADAEGLEEEPRPDSEDEGAASDGKDGRHFLRTVDQTEREIRGLITATEADLASSGAIMSDEVSGVLRTAIGKATLLVTDKFAQFRGLCEENLAANGATPYATRCSDLEGFWEMVGLQVADIRRMFKEIRALRDNGWCHPEPPPKAAPSPPTTTALPASSAPRKVPRRPATAPTGAKRSTAASAARDEARKRLMAAKREAMAKKKAAAAAADPEPDIIFVS